MSSINPLTAADARLSINLTRVRALELDLRAREKEHSRCARDSALSFNDAGMVNKAAFLHNQCVDSGHRLVLHH